MQELVEFRIPEQRASKILSPSQGTCLGGSVRRLVIPLQDPLCERIAELDREAKREGRAFYTYWHIERRYTAEEVQAAEAFRLIVPPRYEPAGEECGTVYDESSACPHCGAGRRQVSDLILNLTRLPRTKDIAKTITDEMVVNERLAELIRSYAITGAAMRPVKHFRPSRCPPSAWFHLRATPPYLRFAPRTRTGETAFDGDFVDRFRCPLGHVAGLNLVSELWVLRNSWSGNDFSWTQEQVGVKRGLLRPTPLMVISQRFFSLLRDQKIRGWKFEVAHLV